MRKVTILQVGALLIMMALWQKVLGVPKIFFILISGKNGHFFLDALYNSDSSDSSNSGERKKKIFHYLFI